MKAKRYLQKLGIMFLMSMICILPAMSVSAASIYDVTFKCATTDQSQSFGNEDFKIYQIVNENNEKIDGFGQVQESEDEVAYAASLKEYLDSHPEIECYKRFTTDASGSGEVGLTDGLYLVLGEQVKINGYTYTPVPFVLQVNSSMEDSLTSYVKYDTTEPKPTPGKDTGSNKDTNKYAKTVKTGDRSKSGMYMLLAYSSILIIAMTAAERRRGKREK